MKPTLGIYGIQDRGAAAYPNMIHDHSICLMENGRVIKFAQLERLTGRKHDNRLPQLLYGILKNEGLISSSQYDVIFTDSVIGRAFLSFDGNIRYEVNTPNNLQTAAEAGRCWWFDKDIEAVSLNHELAHLYSIVPFYGRFKNNSLLIHFDGGASRSNFSAWHYADNQLKLLENHWDLKHLSGLFDSNALNFSILNVKRHEHNSLPGKYMGFASYGHYQRDIEEWLRENDFFQHMWGKRNVFIEAAAKKFDWRKSHFSSRDTFLQNIAATMQHIFTGGVLEKVRQLQRDTQASYLYYSGGCALNIKTNTALVNSGWFNDVFIPPCCNDTGLALGAATYLEMQKGNEIEPHGPFLNSIGLEKNAPENSPPVCIGKVADAISNHQVVATCIGKGEAGPRALGNRSILARADSRQLAQHVSMEMKQREWYRPLAPVMLAKNAKQLLRTARAHHAAQYMLLDFLVNEAFAEAIKGVVHADNTARVQVIYTREQHPFLYDLLTRLDEKHSIQAIINTSFNGRGQPIVHTPADAVRVARQLSINQLIVASHYH